MPHTKNKRDHALTLASAHHLKQMGHITPMAHDKIKRHAHRALNAMRKKVAAAPKPPAPAAPMSMGGPQMPATDTPMATGGARMEIE